MEHLIKKYKRYGPGVHPAYDESFEKGLRVSFVANDRILHNARTGPLFDLNNVRSMEAYLENYADDAEVIPVGWPGDLTLAEQARFDMEEADRQFKLAKRTAINTGFRPPASPTTDQLEAQAVLDIVRMEQEWLTNRIAEVKREQQQRETEERRQRMNREGINGTAKIHPETGRGEIDHQLVAPLNGNGIVMITEGPYANMSVLDYREFIIPAYRQAVAALEQKREERYKELRKAWIANGMEHSEEPQRSTNRIVLPVSQWPKWPAGIPKHLEEKGLIAKERPNGKATEPKKLARKK